MMTRWCLVVTSQVGKSRLGRSIQAEGAGSWSGQWVMLGNMSLLLWWDVGLLRDQVVDAFLELHI